MPLVARDCAVDDIDDTKDTPESRYNVLAAGDERRNIFLRVKEDTSRDNERRNDIQWITAIGHRGSATFILIYPASLNRRQR